MIGSESSNENSSLDVRSDEVIDERRSKAERQVFPSTNSMLLYNDLYEVKAQTMSISKTDTLNQDVIDEAQKQAAQAIEDFRARQDVQSVQETTEGLVQSETSERVESGYVESLLPAASKV